MPFALFVFLVAESLLYKTKPDLLWLCASGLCLSLTRAEGPLWALTFALLAFLFRPDTRGNTLRFVAWIIVVVILHTAFRYYYYQEFLPNTVAAKLGMSAERLGRGACYIIVFILTFLTPVFALGALACKRSKTIWLTTLCFGGFYAYAVVIGGDYMSMGRFLIPSIPFQALLMAVVLERLAQASLPLMASACVALVAVSCAPLADWYFVPRDLRALFHFRLKSNRFVDEHDHLRFMRENSRRWRATGEHLARHSQPGDSLVEDTVGNIGYFSNLFIYDQLGLVTKLPREFQRPHMSSPGHDMRAPLEYFLQFEPTYLYADLERLGEFGRLKELEGFYPYAPTLHRADYNDGEEYVFVTFDRVATPDQYAQKWKELRDLN